MSQPQHERVHSDEYAYSDLPEVSPASEQPAMGYLNEKLPSEAAPAYGAVVPQPYDTTLPQVVDGGAHPSGGVYSEVAGADPSTPAAAAGPRPWWKRRLFLVLVGVVLVCAIVAGVVAGVLVSKNKADNSDSESSSTPTGTPTSTASAPFGTPTSLDASSLGKSKCSGTMCAKTVAVATDSDNTTLVFARGADQAIWYRGVTESGWTSDWTSLGGNFLSQPAAVSMREATIAVFGVASNHSVVSKTYQGGKWDASWLEISGATCSAQVTATAWGTDKIGLFCANADAEVWWIRYKGGWATEWGNRGSVSLGSPGASSGESYYISIATYGQSGFAGDENQTLSGMLYSRYEVDKWLDWEGNWGDFQGDPEVVAVSQDQSEYFGVDVDGAIWHNSWIAGRDVDGDGEDGDRPQGLPGNYTTPTRLGGDFQSTPVAFSLDGSRLDVVAVGTNNTLLHKARVDGDWADEWDDLGGYFNSAPAIWLNGTEAVVFGLGPDDSVIHTTISIGSQAKWSVQSEWYDDGGSFTTNWFSLS